jgi:hypothetical protein
VLMRSGRCCCPILIKFVYSRPISFKLPISNFTEIRLVEAALLYADRRTDKHDGANRLVSLNVEK